MEGKYRQKMKDSPYEIIKCIVLAFRLSLRRFGYSLIQSLKRALLHKGWTLEGADFVWIKQQL